MRGGDLFPLFIDVDAKLLNGRDLGIAFSASALFVWFELNCNRLNLVVLVLPGYPDQAPAEPIDIVPAEAEHLREAQEIRRPGITFSLRLAHFIQFFDVVGTVALQDVHRVCGFLAPALDDKFVTLSSNLKGLEIHPF